MGSVFDNLKLTMAEAKSYLRVDNDAEDALIQDCLNSAKSEIDTFLGNDFEQRETIFRADGVLTVFDLNAGPIYRVTGVWFDNIKQGTSKYTVDTTTGAITFLTAPTAGKRVRVVFEAEPVIPDSVRTWVLRRVAHLYERRTLGVSTQSDGAGSVSWRDDPEWTEAMWQLRVYPGF